MYSSSRSFTSNFGNFYEQNKQAERKFKSLSLKQCFMKPARIISFCSAMKIALSWHKQCLLLLAFRSKTFVFSQMHITDLRHRHCLLTPNVYSYLHTRATNDDSGAQHST